MSILEDLATAALDAEYNLYCRIYRWWHDIKPLSVAEDGNNGRVGRRGREIPSQEDRGPGSSRSGGNHREVGLDRSDKT